MSQCTQSTQYLALSAREGIIIFLTTTRISHYYYLPLLLPSRIGYRYDERFLVSCLPHREKDLGPAPTCLSLFPPCPTLHGIGNNQNTETQILTLVAVTSVPFWKERPAAAALVEGF